jgi:hypothetical protein
MISSLPIVHYRATSVSADGIVKTGGGFLHGFLVTASASGVIRLYDNTAASGTVIVDQLSVAAGDLIDLPVEFVTGLYFDLVSGTATVTILYI